MNTNRAAAMWGIILLLLLGWGCSKAPLPPENVGENNGNGYELSKIIISSADYEGQAVDSAEVYFDGQFIGYTPLTKEGIEPGIHSLRVQKQGYQLYTESITINPSQPVYIEALLKRMSVNKGQLFVTVDRDSAVTVLKNDKDEIIDLFYTREKSFVLDPGGYFLRSECPGYRLFYIAFEIKVDSIVIQNIHLEKLENLDLPEIALAVPDSGRVNEPVVISWESNNAERVDIDYVEDPGLSGKREIVFKLAGKKYIQATAYNENGNVTVVDSIFIYDPVTDPQLPPTVEVTVYPRQIKAGEFTTIRWKAENATSVSVDFVANPGLAGAWQVQFLTPGRFPIEAHAYGPGGTAVASDTLIVEQADVVGEPPVIETFMVTPDSIQQGEIAVLSWVVKGENVRVMLDQSIGEVGMAGNQNVSPRVTTTYTISATNSGGVVTKSVVLKVGPKDEQPLTSPSLEFSVTPDIVEYGKPVLVSWASDGYQVIIDQGIGIRGPSGNEEVYFENPGLKIFTAVAYSEDQTKTIRQDSVYVKEPEQPTLPIIYLSVVDSVEVGEPVIIEWHSQNAERVDVDYVQSPGLNGKTEVIFHSEGQRIISATAYNAAGQVTVSDTVEVVNITIQQQEMPIYITSMAKVTAIHPTSPQVIENAGQAQIVREGFYRVMANVWYNSGDNQKNESFFILIRDENQNIIYPEDPNAGPYKVVPDDPGPPHVTTRDAGMFYLPTGQITIELHHYYTISQQFPQFVVDGPITGAESVQVISFKLIAVQP